MLRKGEMSDFTALRDATLALRDVLRAAVTNSLDPSLAGIPVDVRSPREMKDDGVQNGISLWLYRVSRFADLVNTPDALPAADFVARKGLPLELFYLVTPVFGDAERRQILAGRVLQAFHDATPVDVGTTMELRVHVDTIPLQEHTMIWQTLALPPVLSLPFLVQVVTIDSALPPRKVPRVVVRDAQYAQIVGTGDTP